jgi:hypothetical protein
MDALFLKEFSDLLQESENLLAISEPDTAAWEAYARTRELTFARLQTAEEGSAGAGGERAQLRELIETILERDRLLMQRLEECLARCREGLSALPKRQQALRGYFPARVSSLQRQA